MSGQTLPGDISMVAASTGQTSVRGKSPNELTLQPDLFLDVSNQYQATTSTPDREQHAVNVTSGAAMQGGPRFTMGAAAAAEAPGNSGAQAFRSVSGSARISMDDRLEFRTSTGQSPTLPFTVTITYYFSDSEVTIQTPDQVLLPQGTQAAISFNLRIRTPSASERLPEFAVSRTKVRDLELPNFIQRGSATGSVSITVQPGEPLDIVMTADVLAQTGTMSRFASIVNPDTGQTYGYALSARASAVFRLEITEIQSSESVGFYSAASGLTYPAPEPSRAPNLPGFFGAAAYDNGNGFIFSPTIGWVSLYGEDGWAFSYVLNRFVYFDYDADPIESPNGFWMYIVDGDEAFWAYSTSISWLTDEDNASIRNGYIFIAGGYEGSPAWFYFLGSEAAFFAL